MSDVKDVIPRKNIYYFCLMYFTSHELINSQTGEVDSYYRLMRNYRDVKNRVRHSTVLNIGFLPKELTKEALKEVAGIINDRYLHKTPLFPASNARINAWVEHFWKRILEERTLDIDLHNPDSQHIVVNSMYHEDVREVGGEWLAYNAWKELHFNEILKECGLNEQQIKLACTQVISRAVHPASELATTKIIHDNSAICELTGYPVEKINKDALYRSALRLYTHKNTIERKLSKQTNDLFKHQDNYFIFDLTNTYFEGVKKSSTLAQYGRSKEKRSDAKLVVLSLAINELGFVKYSSIHEGNFADSSDITTVLDNLVLNTGQSPKTVVMDAGIATAENLKVIREKGYHYVCVSRERLKDYGYASQGELVEVETKSGKIITLKKVKPANNGSYYYEINSPEKALKEQSMKTSFEQKFEANLEIAKAALSKRGGTKKINKVHERIGRYKEQASSTHGRYKIEVIEDKERGVATDITWEKIEEKEQYKQESLGRYFLQTSMDMEETPNVWHVYNIIREVEATFRTLKTDLDLRPIYHKNDESTKAHLHLGILAYWLVNTIRCHLKAQGIRWSWSEILRIASTQTFITTKGQNTAGAHIQTRKCSEPSEDLKLIQQKLGIRPRPTRIESNEKSVAQKEKLKKIKTLNRSTSPPI